MKPVVPVLAALAAWPAAAQDAARGRALYETHCLECHYERVHQRDPSRSLVRSFASLQAEVARRAELVPRRFELRELDDVAEYLNRTHYRLPR